jgi:hypothetical protein
VLHFYAYICSLSILLKTRGALGAFQRGLCGGDDALIALYKILKGGFPMNIKAFFTMPLAFLMMLVSLALPPKTQADNSIAEIYVRYDAGSVLTLREYKIDLARRNLWAYEYYGAPETRERDEKALFEGFAFAGRLSKIKIAAFLAAAETNDFTAWEGDYPPTHRIDGNAVWRITIVFADGTTRVSSGDSPDGYPEHWAEMRAAFKTMTGRDIL